MNTLHDKVLLGVPKFVPTSTLSCDFQTLGKGVWWIYQRINMDLSKNSSEPRPSANCVLREVHITCVRAQIPRNIIHPRDCIAIFVFIRLYWYLDTWMATQLIFGPLRVLVGQKGEHIVSWILPSSLNSVIPERFSCRLTLWGLAAVPHDLCLFFF